MHGGSPLTLPCQEEGVTGCSHGFWQEDAWAVISAFFEEKGLVRQQLDSFNEFINSNMQEVSLTRHLPCCWPGTWCPLCRLRCMSISRELDYAPHLPFQTVRCQGSLKRMSREALAHASSAWTAVGGCWQPETAELRGHVKPIERE